MRRLIISSFLTIYCLTIIHCHPFSGNKKAVEKTIAFGNKRYKAGKAIKWDKKPVEMMYDSKDNLYMLCTDEPSSAEGEGSGDEGDDEMAEMYMLKNGEEMPVKLEGMPEANITGFDVDKNDTLYMATTEGIYTYDPAMNVSMSYALPGENITGIYIDHNSTMYVQEADTSNVYTLDKGRKVPFNKVPTCDTLIVSEDNTIYALTNGTVTAMKKDEDTPNLIGQFDQDDVLGMYLLDLNLFVFLTEGVVFSHLRNPTRFRIVEDILDTPICMAADSRNNIVLSFWFDDLTTLILV